YFPMATEQPVFSLSGSRQSSAVELLDYAFALGDDRKLNRKFTFQLVSRERQSLKPVVFACSSDRELEEWRHAFQTRAQEPKTNSRVHNVPSALADALRRAEEAFAANDSKRSNTVDVAKLHALLQSVGWQLNERELRAAEQQLDPSRSGKIPRDRFLFWAKSYCAAQQGGTRRFREAAEALVCELVEDLPLPHALKRMFRAKGLVAYLVTPESTTAAPVAKKQRLKGDNVSLQVPLQCTVDHLGFRCIVFASSRVRALERVDAANCYTQLQRVFKALGLMTDSLDGEASSSISDDDSTSVLPSFLPKSMQCVSGRADIAQRLQLHSMFDTFTADVSSSAATPPAALSSEFARFKLRPEFVRQYGAMLPLHANAHLLPALSEELERDGETERPLALRRRILEAQLLQQAALSASQFLQCEVVPAFVRSLEESAALSARVIDSRSLTAALHESGINVRYLGLCFSLATTKHVRRLLLAEMVARVCKIELRALLRDVVQGAASRSVQRTVDEALAHDGFLSDAMVQSQTRQAVMEFFNVVLGATAADAKVFWRDQLLPRVRLAFGVDGAALHSLEALLSDDLVHLPQLFQCLQSHAGVAFEDHTRYSFKSSEPFKVSDLVALHRPRTKLVARTTSRCEDLLGGLDALVANEELELALALTKLHVAIHDAAPHDERTRALPELFASAAELSVRVGLLDDAERFEALALESGARNHAQSARARLVTMALKHAAGLVDDVRAHYALAVEAATWHLGSPHPLLFELHATMADLLSDCGALQDATRTVACAVDMARECFGRTSVVYADARHRQGELLCACLDRADEAIGVLEDAVGVYERHFGDDVAVDADAARSTVGDACKLSAAACCSLIASVSFAESDGARSGVEKAYATARRALALRRDALLPAGHADMLSSLLQLGALARSLGDHFRALEHLRPALLLLRHQRLDEQGIEQVRGVTQAVLQLQLQSLTREQSGVVDKTRGRFSTLLSSLASGGCSQSAAPHDSSDDTDGSNKGQSGENGGASREVAQLLAFVLRKLLADEQGEYLPTLIDKTEQELHKHRQQFAMNLTGTTMRCESAEEPSPFAKRLQSPTAFASRFASFSGVGGTSLPATESPSLASPLSSRTADSPRAFGARSSPLHQSVVRQAQRTSPLTTPDGAFMFGAQLAALLFLAEA
ncbi:hypothetical protein PybrP1_000935, partial [[Pythium] brassicae (nom. inval.)]